MDKTLRTTAERLAQSTRNRLSTWITGPTCPDCGDTLASIGRFTDPFCWACACLLTGIPGGHADERRS